MLFFSADVKHKLVNSFILIVGLLTLLFSVLGILYFKQTYKKKICYLIDEKKNNNLGIFCHIIDSGVICFMFGAIHQASIKSPNLQILLLILLETIWFMHKLYFIKTKIYSRISVEWNLINTNFVRILLISTFYYF